MSSWPAGWCCCHSAAQCWLAGTGWCACWGWHSASRPLLVLPCSGGSPTSHPQPTLSCTRTSLRSAAHHGERLLKPPCRLCISCLQLQLGYAVAPVLLLHVPHAAPVLCAGIWLYVPRGYRTSKHFISVYLDMADAEMLPDRWHRRASFVLMLVNQRDPARSITRGEVT